MSAQLVYAAAPEVGTPGMIAELFSLRQIDSWIAGEEIPFGFAVALSGTDPKQVIVSTSPNDKFMGISVFAQALNVNDITLGTASYEEGDVLPVLSKGRIWVLSAGAVAIGDDAYALPNGSGQFTNDNTGSVNITLYAKFRTAATGANQLVIIELN